jgi:hypothetical protein
MEVACTAKRNFDRECKKTFATKSAPSRPRGTSALMSAYRGWSGNLVLAPSLSGYDPTATWAAQDFRTAKALFVLFAKA